MTTNTAAESAAQLLAERGNAREQLDRLEAEYATALEDAGVLQEDRDNVRVLLESARLTYEQAEAAVAQLSAGTYGTCTVCTGPIGTERLEALPGRDHLRHLSGRRMIDQKLEAILDEVLRRNPGEVEFHQSMREVLDCLGPVLAKHPERKIVQRVCEPARQIISRLP